MGAEDSPQNLKEPGVSRLPLRRNEASQPTPPIPEILRNPFFERFMIAINAAPNPVAIGSKVREGFTDSTEYAAAYVYIGKLIVELDRILSDPKSSGRRRGPPITALDIAVSKITDLQIVQRTLRQLQESS